ncbi:MAG: Uma2 family endonuclease [Methylotetracoccus sp.]|jgi:Uma2 family endonuclease|nr:Uma2 family endonuclease [Methylotetracoccus sp.]
MGVPQHQPLTADDYFIADDDTRWELIDGQSYDMSPAPLLRHQSLSGRIHVGLAKTLQEKGTEGGLPSECRIFAAPVDVVLNRNTVVQPDLIVVCDSSKLANGRYVDGAPDLVVEILSPQTAKKDRLTKRLVYQAAGVPEYWIIDPVGNTLEQYLLDNGVYAAPNIYGPEDSMSLRLQPEASLGLAEWFAEE